MGLSLVVRSIAGTQPASDRPPLAGARSPEGVAETPRSVPQRSITYELYKLYSSLASRHEHPFRARRQSPDPARSGGPLPSELGGSPSAAGPGAVSLV